MEDQVTQQREFVTPSQVAQQGPYYENPEGPRYQNPAEFDAAQQVPPPQPPNVPDFAAMRQAALQQAIEQVTSQRAPEAPPAPVQPPQPAPAVVPQPQPEPQVVYVRRNLTLAELAIVFLLSIGMVTGGQFIWNFATDILPRIEIRDK
jgi:hypothetical protein